MPPLVFPRISGSGSTVSPCRKRPSRVAGPRSPSCNPAWYLKKAAAAGSSRLRPDSGGSSRCRQGHLDHRNGKDSSENSIPQRNSHREHQGQQKPRHRRAAVCHCQRPVRKGFKHKFCQHAGHDADQNMPESLRPRNKSLRIQPPAAEPAAPSRMIFAVDMVPFTCGKVQVYFFSSIAALSSLSFSLGKQPLSHALDRRSQGPPGRAYIAAASAAQALHAVKAAELLLLIRRGQFCQAHREQADRAYLHAGTAADAGLSA